MALLREGYNPWSEPDLLRAYREFPSGAVRAFALTCLGSRKVAGPGGIALLEQIAATGKFWEHRTAAAQALAALFGKRRSALYTSLFTEAPPRDRPPLAAILRAYADASAVEPVIAHVLELTRRKRTDANDPRELADCLAYLDRVAPRDVSVARTFQEVQKHWRRLTDEDLKAITARVRRFQIEAE